ncbi:MAG: dolichyl-phosphate beta-glucosyltransferase [Candidatus Sumerlaeaceae bacterium]
MSDPSHSPASPEVHLSVVVPAYNEEKRLGDSMPVILAYLDAQPYTWELVIVDDGSSDRTSEIAQSVAKHHSVRVLRNEPNQGKGYSIRRGMLEARGNFRLFSDADLSTPIEELSKFWTYIDQGYDVVIGSRALPDSDLAVRQPASRELAGRVFNAAVQTLLVPGLLDTQCGFKLFSARAAEAIFPQQTLKGFAFDVEVLMLARKFGFRIKEAPVRWVDAPGSKVSTWRGLMGFVDLALLKLKK